MHQLNSRADCVSCFARAPVASVLVQCVCYLKGCVNDTMVHVVVRRTGSAAGMLNSVERMASERARVAMRAMLSGGYSLGCCEAETFAGGSVSHHPLGPHGNRHLKLVLCVTCSTGCVCGVHVGLGKQAGLRPPGGVVWVHIIMGGEQEGAEAALCTAMDWLQHGRKCDPAC